MSNEIQADTPQWYVIHTHPKQEERADINLQTWKVETFNPKIKEQRYNKRSNKPNYLVKSLFPNYIFARFELGPMLRKIWYTRGVHSVVGFGGGPVAVSDEVIEMVRAQVRQDGYIKISEEFKSGDRVVVKDGPLKNLRGIFEREMNDSDRIAILLASVHYQGRVLIEKDLIRKVA